MRQRSWSAFHLLIVIACLVTGQAILEIYDSSPLGRVLVVIGCLGVALVIQVIPHEAGHALVAPLVGFTVHRVVLGQGPVVVRGRLGSVVIELRAVPISGCTIATTGSTRAFRSRDWAVTAAGPAVTALIGLWALRWQPAPDSLAEVLRISLVASSIALLVVNLVPWKVTRDGEVVASDGWMLMTVPMLTKDEVAAIVAGLREVARHEQLIDDPEEGLRRVREALADPSYDPVQTRLDLANLLLLQRRWSELLEVGRWLLEHFDQPDQVRLELLNLTSWAAVCLDDPKFVEEAERWSSEALELESAAPAVLNTRGGVLLMKGEVHQGLEMVRRSSVPGLERTERSSVEALLAIGEAKRRNLFDARRHLAASIRADPNGELVAQARRAVSELTIDFEAPVEDQVGQDPSEREDWGGNSGGL